MRRNLSAVDPDTEAGRAGIEKGHLLVYTGVIEKEENGVKNVYQNQCIALGDGLSYEKSAQNPVITGDMLPENSAGNISEIQKYLKKMMDIIW